MNLKRVFFFIFLLFFSPKFIEGKDFKNLSLGMSIKEVKGYSISNKTELICQPDSQQVFLSICRFETKENGFIWLTFYKNKLIGGSIIIAGPVFLEPNSLKLSTFGNTYLKNLEMAYGNPIKKSEDANQNVIKYVFSKNKNILVSFYVDNIVFILRDLDYDKLIANEYKKRLKLKPKLRTNSNQICLPKIDESGKIKFCEVYPGMPRKEIKKYERFKNAICFSDEEGVHPIRGITNSYGACYIDIKGQKIWIEFRDEVIFKIKLNVQNFNLNGNIKSITYIKTMNKIVEKINSRLNIKYEEIYEEHDKYNGNYLITFWNINELETLYAEFYQNVFNVRLIQQQGWPYISNSEKVENFEKTGGQFKVINFVSDN